MDRRIGYGLAWLQPQIKARDQVVAVQLAVDSQRLAQLGGAVGQAAQRQVGAVDLHHTYSC